MRSKYSKEIIDSAYFSMSQVTPEIINDSKGQYLSLFNFEGSERAWGKPRCHSHIVVNERNFCAIHVAFSHKHRGGQGWHYFTRKNGRGIRKVTAAKLTPKQRQTVLDYHSSMAAWVKLPIRHAGHPTRNGERYTKYKHVAVVEGRYYSIFDGGEYLLNKRYTQKVRPHHDGGYYVHATIEGASEAKFPSSSFNYGAMDRAILECEVSGSCIHYNSKEAWTHMRPLRCVSEFRPSLIV